MPTLHHLAEHPLRTLLITSFLLCFRAVAAVSLLDTPAYADSSQALPNQAQVIPNVTTNSPLAGNAFYTGNSGGGSYSVLSAFNVSLWSASPASFTLEVYLLNLTDPTTASLMPTAGAGNGIQLSSLAIQLPYTTATPTTGWRNYSIPLSSSPSLYGGCYFAVGVACAAGCDTGTPFIKYDATAASSTSWTAASAAGWTPLGSITGRSVNASRSYAMQLFGSVVLPSPPSSSTPTPTWSAPASPSFTPSPMATIVPPVCMDYTPLYIGCGYDHTCVLLSNNQLRCFGLSTYGQLGYANTNTVGDGRIAILSAGFVNVGGNVSKLAAGGSHNCVILTNGNVRCWGDATYGRLGLGVSTAIGDTETPASAGDVSIGTTASEVAAANAHTCVVTTSGSVRCWGLNTFGQLGLSTVATVGDNELPNSLGFVNVGGTVKKITCGDTHTCVILTTGAVKCWGCGTNGRLGISSTAHVGDNEAPSVAPQLQLGGNVTQIAAGIGHTCALLTNGGVICWGMGNYGQLGYGNIVDIGDDEHPYTAGTVSIGGTAVQIAVGSYFSCALLTTGDVRCWGRGTYGEMGSGSTANIGDNELPSSMPVVNIGGKAAYLYAGGSHACAVLTSNRTRCWGYGASGELAHNNNATVGDDESAASAGDSMFNTIVCPSPTPTATVTSTASPTPSISWSSSITASPSPSPTITTTSTTTSTLTASPTASPSGTRTSSITASVTGSATPSPSPQLIISTASIQLPSPPCAQAASGECSSALASLVIRGYRMSSVCTPGSWTQAWTRATLAGVSDCNDTTLIAQYVYTEDPGPWLWYTTSIAIAINAVGYVSQAIPIPHIDTALTSNTTAVAWGDVIQVKGMGLSNTSLQSLALGDATGRRDVPCSDLQRVDADTVTCTMRVMTSLWVGAIQWVPVFQTSGAVYAPLPSYMTTPAAVQAAHVLLPGMLPREGGTSLSFHLPQPYWTPEDFSRVSESKPTCRLLVGPYAAPVDCPQPGTTAVTVVSPHGNGTSHAVLLELNGLLNVSVGSVSYSPAGFASSSPPVLLLPSAALNRTLAVTIGLLRAEDWPEMTGFQLFNVSCVFLQLNDTRLVCGMSSTELLTTIGKQDEVAASACFGWGGSRVCVSVPSVLVVRPTVTSVVPQSVLPGGVLIVFGRNFCPYGTCVQGSLRVEVGQLSCGSLNVISDAAITCTVPSVTGTEPTFPTFNVTVSNDVGATASGQFIVVYPSSGFVLPAATLPTAFIPSDASAPWSLEQDIVVSISTSINQGSALYTGSITCSLSTITSGVSLIPLTLSTVFQVTNTTIVNFGRVAVQTTFDHPSVTLSIACSSGSSDVQNPLPLTHTLSAYPLHTVLCVAPPSVTASQNEIPQWSVVIAYGDIPAAQACNSSWSGPSLPPIYCTVSATSSSSVAAILQQNTAAVDPSSAVATFTGMTVGGGIDSSYQLSTRCSLGAIQIPPTIRHDVLITGCKSGTMPSGALCVPCASNEYSDGGSQICRQCPQAGALCSNGILTLLPGMFLAPSQLHAPLDASSALYECALPGGCLVNNSGRSFACAVGYSGMFCGVCDAGMGYARIGAACVECLNTDANNAVLAIGIICALLLLGAMVLRKRTGIRTDSSIALRILLTYIQGISSLKAFRASGTELYKSVMSWTDVLSPAIVSKGPAECALRPSFTSVFFVTMLTPVLVCLCAVLVFTASFLLRSVLVRNSGTVAYAWKRASRENRPVAIMLFVAQLAYMPIVSTCLTVFQCSPPVDGVRYLSEDLRISCESGNYNVLAIAAALILVIVGVGLPTLLTVVLVRASDEKLEDAGFISAWGFMFAGYRRSDKLTSRQPNVAWTCRVCAYTPHRLLWWESTVLLRKAGIVMLARLAETAEVQSILFGMWIMVFLVAHAMYRPFASLHFQVTEGLSLLTQFLTGALALLAMASHGRETDLLAITAVMILMNLVTTVVLVVSVVQQRAVAGAGTLRRMTSKWITVNPMPRKALMSTMEPTVPHAAPQIRRVRRSFESPKSLHTDATANPMLINNVASSTSTVPPFMMASTPFAAGTSQAGSEPVRSFPALRSRPSGASVAGW